MERLDKLITNDTGYSTKSFVLILGAISVFLTNISFIVLLFVDLFNPGYRIESNMLEMGAVIGALDVLLGWLYISKVKSEKKT